MYKAITVSVAYYMTDMHMREYIHMYTSVNTKKKIFIRRISKWGEKKYFAWRILSNVYVDLITHAQEREDGGISNYFFLISKERKNGGKVLLAMDNTFSDMFHTTVCK